MNFIKIFIFALILTSSYRSFAAAGFEDGNKFSVQPVRGSITIYCRSGNEGNYTRYYNCYDHYISPTSHSRFVNDSGVVAKKVRLSVTHENGKVKNKTKKWKSSKGRSKGSFNLWIRSLFQRPILRYGTNNVHYDMIAKSGEVVESGDFDVEVERKPEIYCSHRTFYGYNNDCNYPDRYCRQMYRDGYNCH